MRLYRQTRVSSWPRRLNRSRQLRRGTLPPYVWFVGVGPVAGKWRNAIRALCRAAELAQLVDVVHAGQLVDVTAVVALQVVGVILVVAMLIIPGATAYLLTDRFGRMLVIAPVMSALSSVLGIYLSYWMDASPGGLVVVVQGAVFAVAYLFGPRHGLIGRRLDRHRRASDTHTDAAAVRPRARASSPTRTPIESE